MSNYVDMCDLGRVVAVKGLTKDGKRYQCRVYFQEKGSLLPPAFAGTTEIPVSLFGNGNEPKFSPVYRMGFLPEAMVRQSQRPQQVEEDDEE